jgi:cell division protein FtsL
MSDVPKGAAPENNIYTILLMLATVMVATATVYLAVRSRQLFDTWSPFGGA